MKKNWKSVLVIVLFIALAIFTVVSLMGVSPAPLESDFADAAQYELAVADHDAELKDAHALITIGVLIVAAAAFALEVAPNALIAMTIPVYLAFAGVLSVKQAFAGFSDSTVLLFGAMFIIGEALFQTGLAKKMGYTVAKMCGGSENKLWVGIILLACVMSAFLSNTGTVAVLLPVCVSIADTQGWNRSKLLLPLAYMASSAGMITMVGTPPNMTVAGVLQTYGYEPIGFFEYAWIGIPAAIVTFVYMYFIGNKMLPNRPVVLDDDAPKGAEEDVVYDTKKQILAGVILVAVIITMISGVIDLTLAASIGAVICIFTGCLNEKQVYRGIDWPTIFLFAGALSLANAMSVTGGGAIIADACVGLLGEEPKPLVLFTVLYFVTGILTQFMSNTASAALLCPIGVEIAHALNVSPYAVVIAIGFSASSAFCTPIGTPPNTLVAGPGNLKFMDYVKIGTPLFLLIYIVSIIILPIVWPFALA